MFSPRKYKYLLAYLSSLTGFFKLYLLLNRFANFGKAFRDVPRMVPFQCCSKNCFPCRTSVAKFNLKNLHVKQYSFDLKMFLVWHSTKIFKLFRSIENHCHQILELLCGSCLNYMNIKSFRNLLVENSSDLKKACFTFIYIQMFRSVEKRARQGAGISFLSCIYNEQFINFCPKVPARYENNLVHMFNG